MQTTITRTRRQYPAMPVYVMAAVFLLYALLFPLYRWWDFLIASSFAAAGYWIARIFCPVKTVTEEIEGPVFTTGAVEADEFLRRGLEAIEELPKLDDAIRNEIVSASVVRMRKALETMTGVLKEHPEKSGELRRMMHYYLPTSLKLIRSYAEMEGRPLTGENTEESMKSVENIMGTIAEAFEKQADSLYAGETLDITSDIAVLEGMVQGDYAESPFGGKE